MRHRLARLALPFALFWPFIWAATGVSVLLFLNRMALGTWSLDPGVLANLPIPQGLNTIHMWFLWMLPWFCVATSSCGGCRTPGSLRSPPRWPGWHAGPGVLWAGAGYSRGFVVVSGSFLPPWNEWMYNGVFFVFGLVLHGRQSVFFALFERRWALYALAGLAGYVLSGIVTERHGPVLLGAYSHDCTVWLWSFAVIGLALRFLPLRSELLGYLSARARSAGRDRRGLNPTRLLPRTPA